MAGEQMAGEQMAGEQMAGEQMVGEQMAGEQMAAAGRCVKETMSVLATCLNMACSMVVRARREVADTPATLRQDAWVQLLALARGVVCIMHAPTTRTTTTTQYHQRNPPAWHPTNESKTHARPLVCRP